MASQNKLAKDCNDIPYRDNIDLQRWLLTHLGVTEYENPYTGAQGAISIWQVSKLVPPEIVSQVDSGNDLLCNILEMKKRGWLKELQDSILTDDNDSRRFSMTASGMLQFRKEILPMAQMLISHEQKLEQRIQNSKANSEVKKGFILKLKGFRDKFQDRLESEAIDFIIKTAKDIGTKSIPILLDLMKQSD